MSTSKKDQFIANFMSPSIVDLNKEQQAVREEALRALHQLEFPTLRDERWKYTRVASILKGNYETQSADVKSLPHQAVIEGLEADQIVFVNGFYNSALSNIQSSDAVQVKPLANARLEDFDEFQQFYGKYADHSKETFTALNTAFNADGVYISVSKKASLSRPIHIVHLTTGDQVTYQPRNLFIFNEFCEATVLHSILGDQKGEAFTNAVSEILVGENAHVQYQMLQDLGKKHQHVQTTQVYQSANSTFTTGTFTFGGKLIRNDLNIEVGGQNCETNLNGIYHLNEKQHVDNHTVVDHQVPNCNSNENYKGILNDKATGVFNGKVFVRQEAQKTNAFQSNQNILISDEATINSKPELEIYADDVKCSHGSTTGEIDEDALFYLRSRGLNEADANKLMITAFTKEALDIVENEPFKAKIESLIEQKCSLF